MAYRSLKTLLQAFADTPGAGDSFDINIPGSVALSSIGGYILTDWLNWSTSDTLTNKNHNDVIHFTYDFSAGSKWVSNLRLASPSGLSIGTDISVDPAGRDAVFYSGAWGTSETGNSLAIQLKGRAQHGSYSGGSGYMTLIRNDYKFYTYPDGPTGSADEEWEISLNTNVGTYVAPTLTTDSFNVVIQYPATALLSGVGQFNDMLEHQVAVSVYGYDAGPASTDIPQIEWHTDSSFTSLFDTGSAISFIVNSTNYDGYFYVRYRYHSTDSWTAFSGNPIHWHDRRY